ncbi:Eco57I restriction-modification methylase domain-containing protein [bacterium]|nr:Eco57I restriction-modification methylase domain-containing protein [bacterium]
MSDTAEAGSIDKAPFTLAGRNPDVLTCIANLSNDEVFTPPGFANQMLDMLADAWAASNDGANLWSESTVTFLDPFTKSGVFIREITKRLVDGLAEEIVDLEDRVDHILTKQVFGIGITELTSLLARRSVYCSKSANGPNSIAKSFTADEGNIWFKRIEHTWVGGTDWVLTADEDGNQVKKFKNGICKFCRANQKDFDRSEDLETHAYAFIHTDDIKARMAELFGDDMQFDVIIGNPPYQLDDGGFGASAGPVYHQFVEQAKALEPRLLSVVIPARWYAGGKGLSDFRNAMLTGGGIRTLHDFPDTTDAFPGVNIRGGVCYFVWDRQYTGDATVFTHESGEVTSEATRPLLEPGLTTFIRYNEGVAILRKVVAVETDGASGTGAATNLALPTEKRFSSLVSPRKPFGLATTFSGRSTPIKGDLRVYRNGGICFAAPESILTGHNLLDAVKLFVPYASPGNDDYPHLVLSRPMVAGAGEAATETYLGIGPLESEKVAKNIATYMGTQFFRFMLTLMRVSQHVTRNVYTLVPMQDFSQTWLDDDLAEKYGLDSHDRLFMDRFVKPVRWADDHL